jgi:hypothetical protein
MKEVMGLLSVTSLKELDRSYLSMSTPTSLPGVHSALPLMHEGYRAVGKQTAARPWRHRRVAEDRKQQDHGAMRCARPRIVRVAGDRVVAIVARMTLSRNLFDSRFSSRFIA